MSLEIPITQYLESFNQHLQTNSRTIFSAKFGDGKSFFLKEFKKQNAKDYYFITLYPVNYSVAENADIFEYIKRDIIIQLAEDDILCNIDFEALADSIFNMESLMEVVSFLISFMPHCTFIQKLVDRTKCIFDKYQEKKETYKDFISSFTHQKGGLYECDAYTQMIEKAIQYINNSQEKKTILIIEDLDRIDPAHLFRILNVLGAHIDCCNEKIISNKFGFNNIVTVFDYEITEHIFHHFYGEKANYSGYINKFMAHYPFNYSINQIAIDYLHSYIEKECYISKDTLYELKLSYEEGDNIGNKINKLSVRDVKQVLDKVEDQIIYKILNANHHTKYQTINAATKFIAILRRLNINYNLSKLVHDIKDSSELLNLTSSFILPNLESNNLTNISFGPNDNFNINTSKNSKHIIIETEFIKVTGEIFYNLANMSNVVIRGLNEAMKYIKY